MTADQAPLVWLNKGFSETYNVIDALRRGPPGHPLRTLCTHTAPHFPAYRISDRWEVEPARLLEEDYLRYCLDVVQRHQVRVFFPSKARRMIVAHREAFADRGSIVLAAATPDILHQLENKVEVYRALAGGDWIRLPDYRLATTLEEFDDAVDQLGARHEVICFKPAVSLFGLGFHILREGSSLDRMLGGDPVSITLDQARQNLMEREHFAPLVVMEYLAGAERSVDCLGWQGRLLRCVVRRKLGGPGNEQLLEANPEIVEMAGRITRHFHLSSVFNVQFRDVKGVPHLLEINPRMSGGLHLADLSGVPFAYWAVRLALGDVQEENIPQPRTGLRVGQVYQGVILEEGAS